MRAKRSASNYCPGGVEYQCAERESPESTTRSGMRCVVLRSSDSKVLAKYTLSGSVCGNAHEHSRRRRSMYENARVRDGLVVIMILRPDPPRFSGPRFLLHRAYQWCIRIQFGI